MKAVCGIVFALISVTQLFGQGLSDDQIQQKLLAQPPQEIARLAQKMARDGGPVSIEVDFTRADLDGNGAFSYVVGYYTLHDDTGGFLRVFKQEEGGLMVAGDQDSPEEVGGFSAQLDLEDVNGDGVPEVEVTSLTASGQEELFSLFLWTGSSLHDMLGGQVETGNLVDIDGDGMLEIVDTHLDGNGYDIYKISGDSYHLLKTVKEDPSGLVDARRTFRYVRAFCSSLEPQTFPLEEIHDVRRGGNETVRLRFGGLVALNGHAVSVDQVVVSTITVSPNLTPVRVSVDPAGTGWQENRAKEDKADKNESCAKDRGRITVEVDRREFLQALPQLQPTAPLAAGNQLEVRVTGKVKDGSPLSAVFTARIAGDHGRVDKGTGNDHSRGSD